MQCASKPSTGCDSWWAKPASSKRAPRPAVCRTHPANEVPAGVVLHKVAQPAVRALLLILQAQVDVVVAHPASSGGGAPMPLPPVRRRRRWRPLSCGPGATARCFAAFCRSTAGTGGLYTPQAAATAPPELAVACPGLRAGCEWHSKMYSVYERSKREPDCRKKPLGGTKTRICPMQPTCTVKQLQTWPRSPLNWALYDRPRHSLSRSAWAAPPLLARRCKQLEPSWAWHTDGEKCRRPCRHPASAAALQPAS